MCVILTHMKTATVREVQHHLSQVLKWVGNGEEVQITRRRKPIAKLIAIQSQPSKAPRIDFHARSKKLWGNKTASLSEQIIKDREERI